MWQEAANKKKKAYDLFTTLDRFDDLELISYGDEIKYDEVYRKNEQYKYLKTKSFECNKYY